MIGDPAPRLGRLSSLLLSAVFILALSFTISWPLWRLATGNRLAFSIAVGSALALILLGFAAFAVRKRARGKSA